MVTVEEAIGDADIVVTATGNKDIIMLEHIKAMKDHAILGNIGHFDNEIDMAGLERSGRHGSTSSLRSTCGPLATRAARSSCCPRAAAEPGQCHRAPLVRDEQQLR